MRLIDADKIVYSWQIDADGQEHDGVTLQSIIDKMPTIEPERKVEELLPDGTLHLFIDTDLSKVNRVWVSQNGTHYGDLYYADGEPNCGAKMNGGQTNE